MNKPTPTNLPEFVVTGLDWIAAGGNVAQCRTSFSGIPVEIIIRRYGWRAKLRAWLLRQ